ncbi:hypothetical protein BDV96DRAFT_565891 [Lophiotrema nucula]|uniref:Uncharacterized protein n=1 Tax=Lophiotrema nucula TaxID=690887 RepID=A0A6A5ZRM7_9PLEO|nr:hypothetical protein BDV96DRAFT_565891 [Lophiotrema nucula]
MGMLTFQYSYYLFYLASLLPVGLWWAACEDSLRIDEMKTSHIILLLVHELDSLVRSPDPPRFVSVSHTLMLSSRVWVWVWVYALLLHCKRRICTTDEEQLAAAGGLCAGLRRQSPGAHSNLHN